MFFRLIARAGRLLRSLGMTERFVLLGVAILHVLAIAWGLPSSDGWDVDGIAPRDFLPGLVKTFTPGDYFTYPPLHLALLALLTLPVTLVQLLRAPSFAPSDVVSTFLSVPVMTTFALVARLVSFLMSLGAVLAIGRMAKTIFAAPSARAWAMAVAGVEVAGTYYAHTTNLDLPAFFWSSLALLALVDALENDQPRKLRRVAVLVACAIATKDQSYAVFALTMPIALVAWLAVREAGKRIELVRETLLCAAIAVGLVLLLDGALFNPSGFAARLRFLTGPASQDFAMHSPDLAGRLSALEDSLTFLPNHYPTGLAPFFAMGFVVAVFRAKGRERIAALVPLFAIVSFTLTFNCVARRVEERFLLPQMQLLAVYAGGIGVVVDRFFATRRTMLAHAVRLTALVSIALGIRLSATVLATMMGDARYDAERFIRENARPGEVIETYGNNVYLPRFPQGLTVERIDPRPTTSRNPMPGVLERQDRPSAIEARRPRWVVVGMGYAWRYLQPERGPKDGRVLAKAQAMNLADTDTRNYVRALFAGETNYAKVHVSHYEGSAFLPPHPLHASLATDVLIFERR
jgi:hypothetical protein